MEYFREALALESQSDIANLAMAFALQRKRDYKTALNYARLIIDRTEDETRPFVAPGCTAYSASRRSGPPRA